MENTAHHPTLPPTHHNSYTPPTTATYSTTQDNMPPKFPSLPHTSRNPRHMPPLPQRHAHRTDRSNQRTPNGVPTGNHNCPRPNKKRQMPNPRTGTGHQHPNMATHANNTHGTTTNTTTVRASKVALMGRVRNTVGSPRPKIIARRRFSWKCGPRTRGRSRCTASTASTRSGCGRTITRRRRAGKTRS